MAVLRKNHSAEVMGADELTLQQSHRNLWEIAVRTVATEIHIGFENNIVKIYLSENIIIKIVYPEIMPIFSLLHY